MFALQIAELRDAVREERSCTVCILNYKKDGTKFWNQFYLSPIKCCNNGKVIHYVGIQTDVSECVAAVPPELAHCDSGAAAHFLPEPQFGRVLGLGSEVDWMGSC